MWVAGASRVIDGSWHVEVSVCSYMIWNAAAMVRMRGTHIYYGNSI